MVADRPVRSRPRDGRPRCALEVLLQHAWRNRILYYVAIVVTVTLVIDLAERR